uniref:Uncharacterized protein n=1 Tax=Avena sativa TaxID=4498 RepID=A0ACD5ZMC5_AVESA
METLRRSNRRRGRKRKRKVDKNMLDQPGHVQISELKLDVASSWLHHKKFGSDVIGKNPEIITIQVGQDVATKIMSYSENGWGVCILSAHGALSNVTLFQGAYSRETLTYEGYFEMISLSGSYEPSETNGMRSCTGGLRVSLVGPLGRVFCGGVAGPLIVASPVQVVIGRFPVDDKRKFKPEVTGVILGASSSTPGGASNGSSGPISTPNQSTSSFIQH